MKNKKLFTIVVPMYNVECFLKDCLNSLVNQSSKNFCAILIDDGSIDKTKEIALSYVEQYPNIFKYIYQKNKGLGGARNTGIDNIDTKYSIFLDSDDFIAVRTIEYLEELISKQEEEPDIILTGPTIYNSINKTYWPFYDNFEVNRIFTNKDFTNVSINPEILSLEASFWRCIWRTEFLKANNVRFMDHVAWEDVPVHFVLFHEAKRIIKLTDKLTFFYRTNTGGQITAGTGKSRLDMPIVFKQIVDIMKQQKWPMVERAHVINILQKFVKWTMEVISDEYRKEFVESTHILYKSLSKKEYKAYKKYIHTSFKLRMMFKLFRSNSKHKILADRSKTIRFEKRYEKLKRKAKTAAKKIKHLFRK